MSLQEFREFLREQIDKSDISIRKLGRKSGVHHSYISKILNEHKSIKSPPSPEIIKKISDNLPCSYAQMMIKAGYYEVVESNEKVAEQRIIYSAKDEIDDKDKEMLDDVLESNELKMLLHEARGMSKDDLKRIIDIAKTFNDNKI